MDRRRRCGVRDLDSGRRVRRSWPARAVSTRSALALWETAARYLMYWRPRHHRDRARQSPGRRAASSRSPAGALLVGSLIFCGTVAILALGGPRWLGAITPIGGLLMIVAFVLLAIAVLR